MDFALTEDQTLIRNMARQFAEDRLKLHEAICDEQKYFPVKVTRESDEPCFAGIDSDN